MIQFPFSIPLLDLPLTRDCRNHLIVKFKPDQLVYAVAFGEPFCEVVFMLVDARDQVACHSRVQSSVTFAGEDVYGWLFGSHLRDFWIPIFMGMTVLRDRHLVLANCNAAQTH